jgi:lipopolysaccharide export system protein LptC
VKNFDAQGVLVSELTGRKARHLPVTDVLEIDQARMRSMRSARVTTGQSNRAYSNGDGSEVQLVGDAVVVREAGKDAQGRALARVEFRGEFLHAFLRTEELKSHKPVTVMRDADQFSGDSMIFNKIDSVVQLDGRVRVRLDSRARP